MANQLCGLLLVHSCCVLLMGILTSQNKPKSLTDEEKRSQRDSSATLKQLNVLRLLALAKPETCRITIALISLLIASATFLVVPKLFGQIIDVVLKPDSTAEDPFVRTPPLLFLKNLGLLLGLLVPFPWTG